MADLPLTSPLSIVLVFQSTLAASSWQEPFEGDLPRWGTKYDEDGNRRALMVYDLHTTLICDRKRQGKGVDDAVVDGVCR
jgi:hypothetical protein